MACIDARQTEGAFGPESILQIPHSPRSAPLGLPAPPAHALAHCKTAYARALVLLQQGQQASAGTAAPRQCYLNFGHSRAPNAL